MTKNENTKYFNDIVNDIEGYIRDKGITHMCLEVRDDDIMTKFNGESEVLSIRFSIEGKLYIKDESGGGKKEV